MNLSIRKAVLEDAEALLRLLRDCVAAMRAAGIEQWDEVYPNADTVVGDTRVGTLDVLCDGDEIGACITIDQNFDPLWAGMDWSAEGEPAGAVHRLMVHPSWQGRGCAKRLMLHAEEVVRVKGWRSIRLDSFLANAAAMALYPRLDYRKTGEAMLRKGPFTGFEKLLK
jgi:GNAT superfamily N-acetyltransferase